MDIQGIKFLMSLEEETKNINFFSFYALIEWPRITKIVIKFLQRNTTVSHMKSEFQFESFVWSMTWVLA